MMRFIVTFICLSVFCACASQAKYKEVNLEAELRKSSADFTARNPESAGPINGKSATPQAGEQYVSKASTVAKPTIMVLPAETRNIHQSQDILSRDPMSRAAENAIHGYLTKKMYTVISAEGTSKINEVVQIQSDIAGQDEDLSYISSLSFGADVYIKYSYDIHRGQILANLGAYESASGRMLGSQTATVNDNGTRKEELVSSAMHKAMPGLEKKILAYFAEDSKIGTPYKVILKFSGESDDRDGEQMKITDLLKKSFNKVKINAMTESTADLTLYADAKKFSDAYEVYDAIRKTLAPFTVKKNSLVQKLLILEVLE